MTNLFADINPVECLEVKLPSGRITRLPIPKSVQVIEWVEMNGMIRAVDKGAWDIMKASAKNILKALEEDKERMKDRSL